MAWNVPISQTTAGTTVNLGGLDSVFVTTDVVLMSTDSNVIRGTGSGHSAVIYGTVIGTSVGEFAVHLGDSPGSDHGHSVHVKSSGHVQSLGPGAAVAIYGYESEIINEGIISSIDGAGVVLRGSQADTRSVLINSGVIEGYAGVTRFGTDPVAETIVLRNSGTISGELASYTFYSTEGGAARDILTNNGKMIGRIDLGKGDDRYLGRNGTVDGNVNGGGGSDLLIGGREKNRLNGDAGADTIRGGRGADILTGGADDDVFQFNLISESGRGASKRDVIGDFAHAEGDVIDLHAIDANTGADGDQKFRFIGSKAFSQDAGEIRYQVKSGETLIYGDVDGNGTADFEIEVTGSTAFLTSDFIL
ncbi:M10 family metallopeptidase C-terminal domain-containing protein [Rhizobium alvei]|uniref:Peptidase M10 serralysin C-terminal domain-containing protein n=1 Tax=Rhizobium alvei TaxID=1132659 RepID=A0ABT8YJZ8_9HYPH|nr:hypothetical protein [Rhizobium alvei]MDO6963846.1 hypothetical protein [Rhizobium alvei]